MRPMLKPLAALLMLLPAAALGAESAPVRSDRAEAVLMADQAAVAPGGEVSIGLRLRLAPGWHTYWRNAGDAGAPPEVVAKAPEAVDAGELAVVDAGAPAEVVTTPAPPPAPSELEVSLDSNPPVDVLLDGKLLGRTPWTGRFPPGRRVFTLQNKELLLSTARAITLTNEPVSQRYTFEKGFVAVKAPEGAAIFIDGTRVGTAPIRGEIPVYEGSHRITVNIGQSKWSEPFNLYGGQRVSFNVEMQ